MYKILVLCIAMVAGARAAADKNLVELATELGATTLVQYLQDTGLDQALMNTGPFTVFAPTNAAFNALPDAVKAAVAKDKDLLKKVLMFHAADGSTRSTQLSDNMLVATLDTGLKIRVNIVNQTVLVDGARVTMADQVASNGIIHVIDHVLYPLPASNIPTTVATTPQLSTLLYAVAQAQLTGALSADGPLTVFAPNNAAFDKLPAGALSDLLSNQTALIAVLEYHVIKGAAYSAGLTSGSVKTLEGRSVSIRVSNNGVMVENAKVVMADIPASNGVIHEIDHVIIPSS